MPAWFTPASPQCHEMLAGVIEEYHPDLMEAYAPPIDPDDADSFAAPDLFTCARRAAARIGLVMAHADPESDKPAMTSKGMRILGKIKANSEADRIAGAPDATITLDAAHWKDLAEDEVDGFKKARALLDHELYHLEVRREKDSKRIVTDDAGRPKFRMRPHDWEVTGFREVAERHKRNAAEVIEARRFHDEYGNILFGFAEEFAVQRDMDFAKEVIGLTEQAVGEINRDHEAAGSPPPFVGKKRPTVQEVGEQIVQGVADAINAGGLGPGVSAEVVETATGRRAGRRKSTPPDGVAAAASR